MPRDDQAALNQARELDADIAAQRVQEAQISTPPFESPLAARDYNVTVQMMARVISDLSEGQVAPEFEKVKGQIDTLPPDVFMALQVLASFPGSPLQFDPVQLATDPGAFADFAGQLSSLRSNNASRPKRDAKQLAALPTVAESRAVDDRATAGGILDAIG